MRDVLLKRLALTLTMLGLIIISLGGCAGRPPAPTDNPLPGLRMPEPFEVLTTKLDRRGNEVWTQTYSGENLRVNPIAMDIDSANGIVITGNTNGETSSAVTVKYDKDGRQLWAATYGGLAQGEVLMADGQAIDEADNIYVAGQTDVTSADPDYKDYVNRMVTIKYDPNGNQLWSESFSAPGTKFTAAADVMVDRSGDVCVAGGSVEKQGYLILKYDGNGKLLWNAVYEDPGHQANVIRMAVDIQNNLYVTGYETVGTSPAMAYLTVKYSPAGELIWAASYSETAGGYNQPHDLAVDADGNVFVTGESDSRAGRREFATVKYNSEGRQVWVARYDDPANVGSTPISVMLSDSGEFYVVGRSSNRGTAGDNYATVKYDETGKQLWAVTYQAHSGTLNEPSAATIDRSGNVYVTGGCLSSRQPPQHATIATVKYDKDGNQVWASTQDRQYYPSIEVGIQVDSNDNVVIVGSESLIQ